MLGHAHGTAFHTVAKATKASIGGIGNMMSVLASADLLCLSAGHPSPIVHTFFFSILLLRPMYASCSFPSSFPPLLHLTSHKNKRARYSKVTSSRASGTLSFHLTSFLKQELFLPPISLHTDSNSAYILRNKTTKISLKHVIGQCVGVAKQVRG